MTHFDKEYRDYCIYLEEYFPNSVFLSDVRNYRKSIMWVFKSLKMIDILKDVEGSDEDTIELLEDISLLFYKFLYIIPINDYYFISVAFRGLSEAILRMFYHHAYPNKTIKDIRNTQYRFLWERGIKTSNLYDTHKEYLDKLNFLFGEYSKVIHVKKRIEDPVSFLTSMMDGETRMKASTLNSHISQIISPVMDCFIKLVDFEFDKLSLASTKMYRELFI